MRNVHRRRLPVPAARAGALLNRLSSPDDVLWPATWPPMRLDRPLAVGAGGGHGPIRYHVTAYEPGRRLELTFDPVTRLRGTHTFVIHDDGADACVLEHVLQGSPTGSMHLAWPLVFRWLHDALIEDAFDNAERLLLGSVERPARWSWWVRFLRARFRARAQRGRDPRTRGGLPSTTERAGTSPAPTSGTEGRPSASTG